MAEAVRWAQLTNRTLPCGPRPAPPTDEEEEEARAAERAQHAAEEAERKRVAAEKARAAERAQLAAEEAERKRVAAEEARALEQRTIQALQTAFDEEQDLTEGEALDNVCGRQKRKRADTNPDEQRELEKQFGVYILKSELDPNHRWAQALEASGYEDPLIDVDVGFTGGEAKRIRQHATAKYCSKITVLAWLPCVSQEHARTAEQAFHKKWRNNPCHHEAATGVKSNTEMYMIAPESVKDLKASLALCVSQAQARLEKNDSHDNGSCSDVGSSEVE